MGQILHGSAKTTYAIRAELQRSQASVAQLAKQFGINEKTVIKWRNRQSVEDMPMGPKERRSSVLSPMEEAAIVALRVQARLPLDDVFIALKDVIPHLTRSSLHRCLQRHVISRLPKADREKPKKFKKYEIGYFHIDIAELRYEGGKGFLFVAVDRTSKLVFARIYRRATKLAAAAFLNRADVSGDLALASVASQCVCGAVSVAASLGIWKAACAPCAARELQDRAWGRSTCHLPDSG